MDSPFNIFWYSVVAVQFLFFVYLIWARLAKSYPIFTVYLGVSVAASLTAVYFMRGARGPFLPISYTYYYLWAEPVMLLLQVAVTLEVHAGIWREHASILRPTRPLLLFALLTALGAAAIPTGAELAHARASMAHLQAVMHFEFLARRYVASVLAIFLALSALLFLIVIRDSLRSSRFRHESMLALYLSIYAVCYLVTDIGWTRVSLVNEYLLSAITLCLIVWMSIIKPVPLPSE